jgi:basic membrane lipoprotein Med (substrate-binding protein (PBP1-ABC) superfamily)
VKKAKNEKRDAKWNKMADEIIKKKDKERGKKEKKLLKNSNR